MNNNTNHKTTTMTTTIKYTLELNDKTNNWDLIDSKGNVEIDNIWSDSDAKAILNEYNS